MTEPSALVDALREALAALEPAALVERALGAPPRGRIRLVAAGKAAFTMTAGALRRWGDRVEDALAIGTDGLDEAPLHTASRDVPITILRARHPLPDERSAEAALEALARARSLTAGDTLLALVSGGASSLLALPPPGVRLERKIALVDALLSGGAPIEAVNLVRRHASAIKGGRLARAAGSAQVETLLLSDVVGGAPCDVGSGPTTSDPTTLADAQAALERHAPGLAAEALVWLSESLAPAERTDPSPRLLADPDALARAVAAALRSRGLRAQALPADAGTAQAVAARRVATARALAPGEAVVVACEPTVALPPAPGRGGRAGRVALLCARDLPDGVALLCAASDGVDGASGSAGALVTRAHLDRVGAADVEAALGAFDDAPLHRRLGTALDLGPTGTNLTDVHVVARLAPR